MKHQSRSPPPSTRFIELFLCTTSTALGDPAIRDEVMWSDTASSGPPASSHQMPVDPDDFTAQLMQRCPVLASLQDRTKLSEDQLLITLKAKEEVRSRKVWQDEYSRLCHSKPELTRAQRAFATDLSFWQLGLTRWGRIEQQPPARGHERLELACELVDTYLSKFAKNEDNSDLRFEVQEILVRAELESQAFTNPFPTNPSYTRPSRAQVLNAPYEDTPVDTFSPTPTTSGQHLDQPLSSAAMPSTATGGSTIRPRVAVPGPVHMPPWIERPDKSKPGPTNQDKTDKTR